MRFNSIVFIEFALLFFLGWAVIRRKKPAALWYLLGASWLFYGYAAWWFVPLLVGTGSLDWAMALGMDRWPSRKKLLLTMSCVSNLSVLATFKYLPFFIRSLNDLTGSGWTVPALVLPIGISFYTFQSMSYVIDVYRGKTSATKSWLEFLAIVSLFAHLVAGPIVRVSNILPQIQELKKPTADEIWTGIDLVCVGFFKKLIIADRLGVYVDHIYGHRNSPGSGAILATAAFAFQIYYDFSGYTDIARGIAKWLGVDFGINFDHPYASIGLAEFWSRWHISLTSWVRDYLYIPLGGNRHGSLKTHQNIWISMVLSGLWHGANWTFVIWGAFHAAILSVEKITNWPKRIGASLVGRLFAAGATFVLVCVGWVFFRAETVHRATEILGSMLHPSSNLAITRSSHVVVIPILCAVMLYELKILLERGGHFSLPPLSPTAVAIRNGVMLGLCVVAPGLPRAFIYFQF